jgi:hypothetical protein
MSWIKTVLENRAARLGMSLDELRTYDRARLREPTISQKSLVLIMDQEHNLSALLDLMHRSNIKVHSVVACDPREGTEARITSEFIPSLTTELECNTPFLDVFDIIQGSDEFRAIATVIPIP